MVRVVIIGSGPGGYEAALVDRLASAYPVYPSMSGSIAEAARRFSQMK